MMTDGIGISYAHWNESQNSNISLDIARYSNGSKNMTFCGSVQYAYQSLAPRLANGTALTLASIGVVGNLLSIIVLSAQKPRTVYSMLLLVLSVADEFVSCCTVVFTATNFIVYFHCKELGITGTTYNEIVLVVSHFHDFAQLFSNWVLIVMTMDRYLAINRPFAGGFAMRRAFLVILLTALGCFLFSLPRFLSSLHLVSRKNEIQDPVEIFIRYFLPLLLLAILNGRLLCYIRHAQREHSELTGRRRDPNRSVTIILILVVVVFLVCGTTRGIYIVIKTGWPEFDNSVANKFTWILMVINSSINFLIYVLFYNKFRNSLRKLILKTCRPGKIQTTYSTTRTHLTSNTSFTRVHFQNVTDSS